MKSKPNKTPEQVKQEFAHRGESIAEWCKTNGVSPSAAYRVLGQKVVTAKRGECHKAAVLLGLKVGSVAMGAA
jgi:gp16 family phage-associated protein